MMQHLLLEDVQVKVGEIRSRGGLKLGLMFTVLDL